MGRKFEIAEEVLVAQINHLRSQPTNSVPFYRVEELLNMLGGCQEIVPPPTPEPPKTELPTEENPHVE